MVIIAGHVQLKPDKVDEARELAVWMQTETRSEEGCLQYVFTADLEDPTAFRLFELWSSAEALAAHFETDHMAKFRAQLPDLVAAPTMIQRFEATTAE